MSMFIKGKNAHHEWHIGDPIFIPADRVVTFQADGHELEMILEAMKRTYVYRDGRVSLSPTDADL